jgi:hypothetical protein
VYTFKTPAAECMYTTLCSSAEAHDLKTEFEKNISELSEEVGILTAQAIIDVYEQLTTGRSPREYATEETKLLYTMVYKGLGEDQSGFDILLDACESPITTTDIMRCKAEATEDRNQDAPRPPSPVVMGHKVSLSVERNRAKLTEQARDHYV